MALVTKRKSLASPARQAILILGMHRSGTSALAGVVRSLGATGPKTLLPTDPCNPRGFWECAPLTHAHNDLLASAGSNWHDWRRLNPQWIRSSAAKRHRQKIKEIIIDEFGDEPLFVIKDPRICRFLPFFSSILEEMRVRRVALLPLRNPLEVAYSLRRRDGFALPKALLLWLRHVLDAEYDSRHIPRCFLTFEDLLMDWRYHLDRAAEKIGVVWPNRSDSSDAKIEQFLTMDLYHERSSLKSMQAHPDVTNLVTETYDILRMISAEGESKDLIGRIDLARTKFDEVCNILGAVTAAEELAAQQLREELGQRMIETEQLQAAVNQQQIQLTQNDEDARQLHADNQRVLANLQAVAKQSEDFRAALIRSEAENQCLAADLHASKIESDGLRSALIQRQAQLNQREAENQCLVADLHVSTTGSEELRSALAQREADNQSLVADLRASTIGLEELRSALAQREADNQSLVADLRASTIGLEELRSALAQREAELNQREANNQRLVAELHASAIESEALHSALAQSNTDKRILVADLQESAKELTKLRAALIQRDEDHQRQTQALRGSEIENRWLKTEIDRIHNSHSWRATKLLRVLNQLVRRNFNGLHSKEHSAE